jgi:hypothetical protein
MRLQKAEDAFAALNAQVERGDDPLAIPKQSEPLLPSTTG